MKYSFRVVSRCSCLSLPTRECGLKSSHHRKNDEWLHVTPYAGVWIEIASAASSSAMSCVTPYAGVWIEIFLVISFYHGFPVTPYAGVWIEILLLISFSEPVRVTPYAGVWIEIVFA